MTPVFDATQKPRVFALPCGVDFPKALVSGLLNRFDSHPPEALARVELIVNTTRMQRRVISLFKTQKPMLLPRITLLSQFGQSAFLNTLPSVNSPLRRRLELAQLITRLIENQPDLAARSSVFDLADSLAALIDEMQGEGVSPQTIRDLDVSDLSGHWARAQSFIGITEQFLDQNAGVVDTQSRQRMIVSKLIENWRETPPQHPIILAGSTGSRGTTQMLMQAIANLPQGAVILPGFDFEMPEAVWEGMNDALSSEDHPQYRFLDLMQKFGLLPDEIKEWTKADPPSQDRNRIVSLALRPAPVTHAWMSEGPALQNITGATQNVSLLEAPTPRTEAMAIALRLRAAAETGQKAALISPDRMLTRRVTAALDRWGILPDDSAGQPLQLSPPGRFLRHVAALFTKPLTSDALLTLLKHPLTHAGAARGEHLRQTRELELFLRKNAVPFPDETVLDRFAANHTLTEGWRNWLVQDFVGPLPKGQTPLADWNAKLRARSESIAAGSQSEGSGTLWEKNAGQKASAVMASLEQEAEFGGVMTAQDFGDLLGSLLSQEDVRDRDAPHPQIMIWGTLEARVMGADLLILAGLNEGSWPEPPAPDPWLNRKMRHDAGLLLPERRIGLSAHDFQQAIAGEEIWLTRAVRSDEADTVPSRWLNRICNLLDGLPDQGGRAAVENMKKRGALWLDRVDVLEEPGFTRPAHRPYPVPPVVSRPRKLSVTEIPRLIRDPYAIYAKHVLRLRPLNPLVHAPDALLRGIVVHEVLEQFIRHSVDHPENLTVSDLLRISETLLSSHVPWPTAQRLWLARIGRVASDFIASEETRRQAASPAAFEILGNQKLGSLDFTISARADRVDVSETGALLLYDYKTGNPPTESQQKKFEKQLLIEAAMAEEGAFEQFGTAQVDRAVFIGLGSTLKEVPAPITEEPPAKIWGELRKLIEAYFEPNQGFSSRRMLHQDTDQGDYDHLARFGEWDRSAIAVAEYLE